jgi:hypothetical protein
VAINHIEDGFSRFPDVSMINDIPRLAQASSESSERRAVRHDPPEILQQRFSISLIQHNSRPPPRVPRPISQSSQKSKKKMYKTVINGEATIFTAQDPGILPYLVQEDADDMLVEQTMTRNHSLNLPILTPPSSTRKNEVGMVDTGLAKRWKAKKPSTQPRPSSQIGKEMDSVPELSSLPARQLSRNEPATVSESRVDLSAVTISKLKTFRFDAAGKNKKNQDLLGHDYQNKHHQQHVYIGSPLPDTSSSEDYISTSILDEELLDIDPTISEQHDSSKYENLLHSEEPMMESNLVLPLQDSSPNIRGRIGYTGQLLDQQDKAQSVAFSSTPGQARDNYKRCHGQNSIESINHKRVSNLQVKAKSYSNLPLRPTPKFWKPFVRPQFPDRLRDRSSITAASSSCVLRTCFRIGEAIRSGSEASRNGVDAITELYARVTYSSRSANDGKQHFQFADLFHEHPPFLNGIHDTWKGKRTWDEDCAAFLSNDTGKMARVIGRLKWHRDAVEDKSDWRIIILSIWEVDWDEIEHIKGIVCFDVCSK